VAVFTAAEALYLHVIVLRYRTGLWRHWLITDLYKPVSEMDKSIAAENSAAQTLKIC